VVLLALLAVRTQGTCLPSESPLWSYNWGAGDLSNGFLSEFPSSHETEAYSELVAYQFPCLDPDGVDPQGVTITAVTLPATLPVETIGATLRFYNDHSGAPGGKLADVGTTLNTACCDNSGTAGLTYCTITPNTAVALTPSSSLCWVAAASDESNTAWYVSENNPNSMAQVYGWCGSDAWPCTSPPNWGAMATDGCSAGQWCAADPVRYASVEIFGSYDDDDDDVKKPKAFPKGPTRKIDIPHRGKAAASQSASPAKKKDEL